MPLLDHFHPPLSQRRHWESFHSAWASTFADALNRDWLPAGYFAEEQTHAGAGVEIDVATMEGGQERATQGGNGPAVGQWYLRAPTGAVKSSLDIETAWSVTTGSPAVVVAKVRNCLFTCP